MTTYSDTTQEVFKRVLELLKSDLSVPALQKVQESIEGGTFENVGEVLNAIEEALSGRENNANN